MTALLTVHLVSTLFMVGLIWFVQLVHYPLFARVGERGFAAYELEHARRTGWVVIPPMLLEAASATLLLLAPPAAIGRAPFAVGFALLGVVWASTALLQVPRHRQLANGFDRSAHRALVLGNWIRTFAWSARGALVTLLAAGALEPGG